MHAFAALFEEARHGALRIDGLEQLDLRVPDGEQRGAHALVLHFGRLMDREAERVTIEVVRVLEVSDHDPNVVDPLQHVSGPQSLGSRLDQSRNVAGLGIDPLLIDSVPVGNGSRELEVAVDAEQDAVEEDAMGWSLPIARLDASL